MTAITVTPEMVRVVFLRRTKLVFGGDLGFDAVYIVVSGMWQKH